MESFKALGFVGGPCSARSKSSALLSRRAAVKAALALASCAAWRAFGGPAAPIRVGFLGKGYSHFKDKYAFLKNSPNYQLVGVCEEDASLRRSGPEDVRWLSRAELFREVELVVVESGLAEHGPHALAALRAGKHVHVEKPPSALRGEFRAILKAAETRKLVLQVGYMWRYNPGFNRAMEAARQGWLGEVYLVRATMNTLNGAEARREWARFPGGAMFEQGSHLIDAVVRLLGVPSRVTPFLKRTGRFGDTLADNTLAVLEYPRSMALVTSAPLQPNAGPQRFFEILGTQGTAKVGPLEPPTLSLDLGEAAGPYVKGRQEVPLPTYRRYVDEFDALARSIREGEPLPVSLQREWDIQKTLLSACGM